MQIIKLIGPPGTGKTSALLDILEDELDFIPAERCAFVSFTRRGTYEGARRAQKKFKLHYKQLGYFRTLHSICFHEMNIKQAAIMQKEDYVKIAERIGMAFNGQTSYELNQLPDEKYVFAYGLYRNNKNTFERYARDFNYTKYCFVVKNLKNYGKSYGKMDFTDMLTLYLSKGTPLDIDVAFIDEAQDLTTLQWHVVNKMFAKAQRIYIAGDDDQAIYEWAGADVDTFIKLQTPTTILEQSYRLPVSVYDYAKGILKNIDNRIEKQFKPSMRKGQVDIIADWSQLEIDETPTLILSRNNITLKDAAQRLRDLGVIYTHKNNVSIENKIFRAIQLYERWRTDTATEEELRLFKLYKDYFTDINKNLPWYDCFYDYSKANYYRAILENKRDITATPAVEISTIHAAKGMERPRVVLALDFTTSVAENFFNNPATELRTLYVGATRAQDRLTIKLKNSATGYPEVWH